MRTLFSSLGGLFCGAGLYRFFISDFRNASMCLLISGITLYIGYVFEAYRNDKERKA